MSVINLYRIIETQILPVYSYFVYIYTFSYFIFVYIVQNKTGIVYDPRSINWHGRKLLKWALTLNSSFLLPYEICKAQHLAVYFMGKCLYTSDKCKLSIQLHAAEFLYLMYFYIHPNTCPELCTCFRITCFHVAWCLYRPWTE